MRTMTIGHYAIPVRTVNTVIVGSGVAALNCALQLQRLGQDDLLIVTEQIGGGTSNNTGSDKQTYYKLSLCGHTPDSIQAMAETLYAGGSMHGDIALIEAALSAQSFYHLVALGVAFPHNQYGEYVGYKTDHDPRTRATSAGPKTSMLMFEALYRDVRQRNIPIYDHCQVIRILTNDVDGVARAVGVLCLDTTRLQEANHGLLLINATNVVYATGGPAIIYQDSVYPEGHTGASGLAFEAGVTGQNLTEWQYGLASIKYRWNVSGTYMQVIPRFISTDKHGGDVREFLNPHYNSMETLLGSIFLKGYQWPFDPRKIVNFGSSLIDLLVYQERVVNRRRVFLDFRANPSNAGNPALEDFSYALLGREAAEYLQASQALLPTPIARLQHMNPLAIDLYMEHGIDLCTEPLEIAVCAQHNNGGLKGNIWWESDVRHFFPIGEVNGSHGVYRPGGSALNSGQCGSLRAAQYIAACYTNAPPALEAFAETVTEQVAQRCAQIDNLLQCGGSRDTLEAYRTTLQVRMSQAGAFIRAEHLLNVAIRQARRQLAYWQETGIPTVMELPYAMKNYDAILAELVYLEAMAAYCRQGGVSRGSYLLQADDSQHPCASLGDVSTFLYAEEDPLKGLIGEIRMDESHIVHCSLIHRRPIPDEENWFENVWRDYREARIFTLPIS